jgi:ABC-type lipoprotein export system ATPase subunit
MIKTFVTFQYQRRIVSYASIILYGWKYDSNYGNSGRGKTTYLHILALLRPKSGSIEI